REGDEGEGRRDDVRADARGAAADGRAGQPGERQRQRDRRGRAAGQRPGGGGRGADVREGERAEAAHAPRGLGGGQADDRDVLAAEQQEHPPLPGLEGGGRLGRPAVGRAGGADDGGGACPVRGGDVEVAVGGRPAGRGGRAAEAAGAD